MEIICEKYKVVEEEVYRFKEEERTLYSSIACNKDKSLQIDMVLDAITDLLMRANFAVADFEIGCGNKYDGAPLRVFNGKYWEHVGSYDLRDTIMKYLRMQGVSGAFARYRDASTLIHNVVTGTCRKKILHPRMTLMCFKNGVVDFGKVEKRPFLRSFDAKYDVVKMYDFAYKPMAYMDAHVWKNFLGEPVGSKKNEFGVLPEDVKRKQMQLFLGSLLIPREKIKFEYFLIIQGTGGNGKSVIFQVLEMLFGKEEVCSLDISQFARKGDERLRAMASLVGKRLLYCPEELIKSLKNIQSLKSLVSGEPQQYRMLKGDIQTLRDVPIVMFNTNRKWNSEDFIPRDDPHDDSMTRRAQIINFAHTIPVNMRDTELALKLEKEKAGIFAWILRGYMELKANGYRMPENVNDKLDMMIARAKGVIRSESGKEIHGSIGLWLERSKIEPYRAEGLTEMFISSTSLFHHYKRFCEMHGFEFISQQRLGRDLRELGYIVMAFFWVWLHLLLALSSLLEPRC